MTRKFADWGCPRSAESPPTINRIRSLVAALGTLALSIVAALWVTANGTLHGGPIFALDPLGALYLLPVSFVYCTSSLYAIGYLWARRQEQRENESPPRYRQYFPLMNVFALVILAVPLLANLALMWIAIELLTRPLNI